MKFLHYSEQPIEFDPSRTYEQHPPSTFGKPNGLWVSVEGEDDWLSWCQEEQFEWAALTASHLVILSDSANLKIITTVEEMDEFSLKYGVETDWERKFSRVKSNWPIDWGTVAEDFDGLIIAPYQYSRRYDWYYGWDCASGCLWNLSAIASVDASVGASEA